MKQGVVADDLTRPFWEAANEGRLVIQHCTACDRLQHPPGQSCQRCGSKAALAWKEMSGRGRIYNYGVVHDFREVKESGLLVGSCSDRPISAQRTLWKRHVIDVESTTL